MIDWINMRKGGLLACLVWTALAASSQQVSRVSAVDYPDEVVVSYRLDTDRPLGVQLYYSEDAGYSWIGPLKKVTGDVGTSVGSGKNVIKWNFPEEVGSLVGDRFKFKVRTSEHFEFSLRIRDEWFRPPSQITDEFGEDNDLAAFKLRQVKGWNGLDMKAPSGNYDFEMHNELRGGDVESSVELLGFRHRPAFMGMVFSAILPGSGIPYVTYGECKNWTVEYSERKPKKGNGNFWGMVLFGGAAVLLHNLEMEAYNEELARPFGTVMSAQEVALPYQYAKYGAGGLAGLIYTMQIARVIKWNNCHKGDMSNFVEGWR